MAKQKLQPLIQSKRNGKPCEPRALAKASADPENLALLRAGAAAMFDQPVAIDARTAARVYRRLATVFEGAAPDVSLLLHLKGQGLHPTAAGARALAKARRVLGEEAAGRSTSTAPSAAGETSDEPSRP